MAALARSPPAASIALQKAPSKVFRNLVTRFLIILDISLYNASLNISPNWLYSWYLQSRLGKLIAGSVSPMLGSQTSTDRDFKKSLGGGNIIGWFGQEGARNASILSRAKSAAGYDLIF